MKRIVLLFSLVMAFWVGALPVWAADKWWSPSDNPTPPMYQADGNRVYTREHWTKFWINEYGFGLGPYDQGAQPIGGMYCSVFDLPNNYTNGYTAIAPFDNRQNSYMGLGAIPTYIENKMQGLGVPQDTDGSYIISPAYWSAHSVAGQPSPFWGQGECEYIQRGGPSGTVYDGTQPYFLPDSTINNPACITNGDTSHDTFIAGAVVNGKPQYWWSEDSNGHGNINLTQPAAIAMLNSFPTKADICFSYIYGVTVSNLTRTQAGVNVGDIETWNATIFNTTPYLAKNVTLRAYLIEEGVSKPVLVATTTTDIGPIPVGMSNSQETPHLGQGVTQANLRNTVNWQFSYPLPDKNFKVLVTANLNCTNGLGSNSVMEPLVTAYAYGNNHGQYVYGPNGKQETVAYSLAQSGKLTGDGPTAYDDNYMLSTGFTGGSSGGGPGPGPGPNPQPANLVADSVSYENSAITAQFHSTFSVSGTANAYFYEVDNDGVKHFLFSKQVTFSPNGQATVTKQWPSYNVYHGLIAAINEKWDGSEWKHEKFNGSLDETTYADNTANRPADNQPLPGPPPTSYQPQYLVNGWYYPVKKVPGTKTIQEKQYYGVWVPVPIHFTTPPGKHVRLYPNPGEPGGPVPSGQ